MNRLQYSGGWYWIYRMTAPKNLSYVIQNFAPPKKFMKWRYSRYCLFLGSWYIRRPVRLISWLARQARIGANTVRIRRDPFFEKPDWSLVLIRSNSHCFVEESPRSCSTSSALIGSKAGRRCVHSSVGPLSWGQDKIYASPEPGTGGSRL